MSAPTVACPHPAFCRTRTAGPCEICRQNASATGNASGVVLEPNDYDTARPAPRKLNRAEKRAARSGRGSGVSLRDARKRAKK